jgi:hypothetical protein
MLGVAAEDLSDVLGHLNGQNAARTADGRCWLACLPAVDWPSATIHLGRAACSARARPVNRYGAPNPAHPRNANMHAYSSLSFPCSAIAVPGHEVIKRQPVIVRVMLG